MTTRLRGRLLLRLPRDWSRTDCSNRGCGYSNRQPGRGDFYDVSSITARR